MEFGGMRVILGPARLAWPSWAEVSALASQPLSRWPGWRRPRRTDRITTRQPRCGASTW